MSVHRRHIQSSSVWEGRVGYSRAVRVGNMVFVSGTTGDGPDAYVQAKAALARIRIALEEAGASFDDVVRTRMFVTNIADWDLVGKAHFEAFGEVRPAATMVQVSALIAPELVVEIEVDAYVA
ncbi:MAG: RidA family protein [Candidatus Eremiobacteraeota bacterium]|nr:RidA family protein [Candidatus Eremiobacteraeota bacterium]